MQVVQDHSKWYGDDGQSEFSKGFAILGDGKGAYTSCDMTLRRFLACAKLIKRGATVWAAEHETITLDWLRKVYDDRFNLSYEWWE